MRPLDQHDGKRPNKWGFLEVSNANVVMSALMPAEDGAGLIVRMYEAAGQPAEAVKLHFTAPVSSASEVNLMEDRLQSLSIAGNSIQFALRPYEIKTFRLQLAN